MRTHPRSKAGLTPIILAVFLAGAPTGTARAQDGNEASLYSLKPADAEACRGQFGLIFDAIEEYRKRHGQWPAWLNDLIPEFIADRSVLTCPFVATTFELRSWRFALFQQVFKDPHTTYAYEFCAEPISYVIWRGIAKTQGDIKRAARIRLGPERGGRVPMVRCFAHRPVLNLGINGETYPSGVYWEDVVAPEHHDAMTPAALLGSRPRPASAPAIPLRDPDAGPRQLDLSEFYNGALSNDWQGFPGNNLAAFPAGCRLFNNVRFDARGVIQLNGSPHLPWSFPDKVEGIPARQQCQRIHFLHAAGRPPEGTMVTNAVGYVANYADGISIPIAVEYFRDIQDWWHDSGEAPPEPPDGAQVAWQGTNPAATSYGKSIRLYHMAWINPRPETPLSHLDFICTTPTSAPFLLAVTLE